MKVNIDGLRRNATRSVNDLHRVLEEIINSGNLDYDQEEELINGFNEVARFIGILNCVYDPNIEDDMNDLSDLETKYLENKED